MPGNFELEVELELEPQVKVTIMMMMIRGDSTGGPAARRGIGEPSARAIWTARNPTT
jgi:hypothetical protein